MFHDEIDQVRVDAINRYVVTSCCCHSVSLLCPSVISNKLKFSLRKMSEDVLFNEEQVYLYIEHLSSFSLSVSLCLSFSPLSVSQFLKRAVLLSIYEATQRVCVCVCVCPR